MHGAQGDTDGIRSIEDVCEVLVTTAANAPREASGEVLVEIVHGATERRHFDRLRDRLTSELPRDLEEFFFVNTDVGAPECGLELARRLTEADGAAPAVPSVLLLRCLVPRTFVDCNRVIDADAAAFRRAGVTGALPQYITADGDLRLLLERYRAYQAVARRAYERVCGAGGLAVTLHTYAPKSVEIDTVGADIVEALRRAYAPAVYAKWKDRPEVDLIVETDTGDVLADPGLVEDLVARYAALGVRAERNATYRLFPSTMAHVHASAWPGRTLCIELRRDLLADPFVPFRPMTVAPAKVARMTAPLASALRAACRRR